MNEVRNIIYRISPCWYEISWHEILPPAIVLRIHDDFIEQIREKKLNFGKALHVMKFKKEFGFRTFAEDFDNDFGFNEILLNKGKVGGFTEFFVNFPKVRKETEETCDYCKESGENELLGRECLHCEGSGKEHIYDWKPAYAISASLNVFFSLSCFLEKETIAKFPQLMTVNLATHRDMHGGSLSGECGIPLAEWMKGRGKDGKDDVMLPEVTNATRSAYYHMFGPSDREIEDMHHFRAYTRDGCFYISCPGDRCGLHPNERNRGDNMGHIFSCHNVDTPMQQITLLAGLAALHDKARKEM